MGIANSEPRAHTGEKSQADDSNMQWRRESDVLIAR